MARIARGTHSSHYFYLTSEQLLFLLITLVATAVFLYRLGDPALTNWDEAIYAELAKEMVQSGDWLTLRWQQAVWFEKPPLTIWLIAILFRVFAVNEFWARAISAFSGVGLVAVVYAIGRLLRGRTCGLLAALVLLTTFQFVLMARSVNTDVLLVLFIYLAIYGYLRMRNGDARWWYLIWASCALGFMVKDFAVLVAPSAITLALVFDRQLQQTLRANHFWFGMLLAAVIVVPWHAAMYYLYGTAFANEYFYYHVWSRTLTALEGHSETHWWYLKDIGQKFYPWCFIAPLALVFHAREVKNGGFLPVLLALIAIVLGVFTLVQTKMGAYILPIYPALALLTGELLTWLYARRHFVSKVAVILLCVSFSYIAVGRIKSDYVKIHEWDEAVRELSLLAATRRVSPNLILFEFERHSALFYSGRRVVQASRGIPNSIRDRYRDYQPLAAVTSETPTEIILYRPELGPLLPYYVIDISAESHNLLYGTIRKKAQDSIGNPEN